MTSTSTDEIVTTEQAVHADIYGVPPPKLVELKNAEPTTGGDLCSVCKRKGCRIGPMMRG